jgi:ATP-dependent RNA helicase RhlE
MQFSDLNLIDPLLRALSAEGYTQPTPIQQQAIPYLLDRRDLVGCAQTGTGKTAAFALPILQHLINAGPSKHGGIRVLVLSPTRELASQIGDSFAAYGKFARIKHLVMFGGVGQQPQVDALRRKPDILIATPGRLLDLMQQGFVKLDKIEYFVLDEADRMLDMGFIHDVRKVIAALPTHRQTLLFSATMPQDIQDLADRILIQPVRVEVTPQATTVEKIAQSVYFVEKKEKRALLEHLLADKAIRKVLVFTRTKHGANKLVEQLGKSYIQAEAIHGNKSQTARERALANFKSGATRVLVATDIAARGLDVEDVTHVINYDLPNEPESYVHRIGRTARAGASGAAYSFCDSDERAYLRDIEKLIRLNVPVVAEHPYMSPLGIPAPTALNGSQKREGQRPQQQQRASNGGNNRPRNSRGGQPRRDGEQQQADGNSNKPRREGQASGASNNAPRNRDNDQSRPPRRESQSSSDQGSTPRSRDNDQSRNKQNSQPQRDEQRSEGQNTQQRGNNSSPSNGNAQGNRPRRPAENRWRTER